MPNPGPPTRPTSLEHPAHSALWQETIEPDDSVVFRRPTRGLYVATGGSLAVVDPFDHKVTYQPSDDIQLPIAVKQVLLTGTTAAGIVGWW